MIISEKTLRKLSGRPLGESAQIPLGDGLSVFVRHIELISEANDDGNITAPSGRRAYKRKDNPKPQENEKSKTTAKK